MKTLRLYIKNTLIKNSCENVNSEQILNFRPFYWGYKFEDYMTNTRGSRESKQSKLNPTVEESSEFNCIFK